jgi:hypothetical protein
MRSIQADAMPVVRKVCCVTKAALPMHRLAAAGYRREATVRKLSFLLVLVLMASGFVPHTRGERRLLLREIRKVSDLIQTEPDFLLGKPGHHIHQVRFLPDERWLAVWAGTPSRARCPLVGDHSIDVNPNLRLYTYLLNSEGKEVALRFWGTHRDKTAGQLWNWATAASGAIAAMVVNYRSVDGGQAMTKVALYSSRNMRGANEGAVYTHEALHSSLDMNDERLRGFLNLRKEQGHSDSQLIQRFLESNCDKKHLGQEP